VTAVFSSDLDRAVASAEPIAALLDLPVTREPALRERRLGVAEAKPADELGPDRSGVENGRVIDADAAPLGGESVRSLHDRVVTFVEAVLRPELAHGDVVAVTHGGVVRVLLAWSSGVDPEGMPWPEVANGDVRVCPLPATDHGRVPRAPAAVGDRSSNVGGLP
jgi:2,3-bisphosphoglycerate-dependent phosphoglycerate mutase